MSPSWKKHLIPSSTRFKLDMWKWHQCVSSLIQFGVTLAVQSLCTHHPPTSSLMLYMSSNACLTWDGQGIMVSEVKLSDSKFKSILLIVVNWSFCGNTMYCIVSVWFSAIHSLYLLSIYQEYSWTPTCIPDWHFLQIHSEFSISTFLHIKKKEKRKEMSWKCEWVSNFGDLKILPVNHFGLSPKIKEENLIFQLSENCVLPKCRLAYMVPAFTIFRMRMYSAWILSECVCIVAALGAYPSDLKSRCGQGPTVDPSKLQR